MATTPATKYLTRNCSPKSSAEISPPPLLSIRLKHAFNWSADNAMSLCSASSGNFSINSMNLASLIELPPPISSKRAWVVLPFSFMCVFNAVIAWLKNTPAVKPPSSAVRGAANSDVVVSRASNLSIWSVASLSNRFATKRCSWSRSNVLCLSSSVCCVCTRSSNALIASANELSTLAVLASTCRLWRKLFVSEIEAEALCSFIPAFSHAAFISSGVNSEARATKDFVASTNSATIFSISLTLASTSRFKVTFFLSAMAFFTSVVFLAATSMRDCIAVSCSVATFADASVSRLAARRFMAKKVFAPLTAVFAAVAAASRSAMCFAASSKGTSSTPRRNGSSAALSFSTLASASLTRSSDSLMIASTMIFSDLCFIAATVVSSFSWDCFNRACNLSISSLETPSRRFWFSKDRVAVLMETCASAAADSATLVAFLLASASLASRPRSKASHASPTLTTFSSTPAILVWASSTAFLAAMRESMLAETFLCLPTSAWAALSRVWYLISSALTSVDISLRLDSICLAVTNFLAVSSASFAAFSALAASSVTARMSADDIAKNFASSARGATMLPISLTNSSALFTSDSASFIVAPFFRAAVFFFNSVSFLMCCSSSPWYVLSFSCASLLGPGLKRFASTNFVAMNIRAMETAVLAAVAATSQPLTAVKVSSRGNSSTPMRKGASASAALVMLSATICSLSPASFNKDSQTTFSLASLCRFFSSCNLPCDALARSSNLPNSSLGMPVGAAAFFSAINLSTLVTCSEAFVTAASAWVMDSLDGESAISMVASSARSTSTSAGDNFSKVSCTNFCAAVLWTNSCRTFLRGFSLFAAACNCCCNFPSSVTALCLTVSLSKRRQLACFALRKIRASPMAFCAS
mmetsp:Transcript_23034/g.66119  ORF Transcript_23034/g.66119 Transcript_23034/m.66119 type:complete len:874 (-) Transcript_23034:1251-3872(-)